MKSKKNRDYISDTKKLTESLPFVLGELALLQPKTVLLPKQLCRHDIFTAAMFGVSPKTLFLPVPQFNATVVNTHLKKYDKDAAKLKRKFKGSSLARWMESVMPSTRFML